MTGLVKLSHVAFKQGDSNRVKALCAEALALYGKAESKLGRMKTGFHVINELALPQGDYARARDWLNECLEFAQKDEELWEVSRLHYQLGDVSFAEGEYEVAYKDYLYCLEITKNMEIKWGIAAGYQAMGRLAAARRDYVEARTMHEKSLELLREIANSGGREREAMPGHWWEMGTGRRPRSFGDGGTTARALRSGSGLLSGELDLT